MRVKALLAAAVAAATLATAGAASATIMFVGSWEVDDGPDYWPNAPQAYTGQQAAALLFGGNASDYQIYTVDHLVADIDHMAWYSVYAYGGDNGSGGAKFAQDYSDKGPGGLYTDNGAGFGSRNQSASAYVNDNAGGSQFTNFAFVDVVAIPEPATWALLLTGFFGMGATLRASRRRAAAIRA